jgi:hypothetical protein
MKTYVVQLENHDDVVSAREKISWSKARRVLLVWPRKGTILQRRVDLLILDRHSRQVGAQLGIVAGSGVVRGHARELGIPIFKNTVHAQRAPWRRGRTRKTAPIRQQPRSDPYILRQQREAFRTPPSGIFAVNQRARLAVFLVGLAAFAALVLFFAPGARVQISPQRQVQRLSVPVWASPEITVSSPSGRLPAYTLSVVVEGRDQAESTGRSFLPDKAAVGQVQLTNLTDTVVDVPRGSIVLLPDSPTTQYAITRSLRLPAGPGETATAPVRAVLPGRRGNAEAGQLRALEGPLGLRLAVENQEPISGGTDRISPAPTEQDYRALRQNLMAELEAAAFADAASRLAEDRFLLEGTLQLKTVLEEIQYPAPLQPADQLQLTLRAEYEIWYVLEEDLRAVAQTALDANLPAGFVPSEGSLQFAFIQEETVEERTMPAASSTAVNPVRRQLEIERMLEADISESSAARAIVGLDLANAQHLLRSRYHLSAEPQITLSPEWWIRLPFLPFRVSVEKQ